MKRTFFVLIPLILVGVVLHRLHAEKTIAKNPSAQKHGNDGNPGGTDPSRQETPTDPKTDDRNTEANVSRRIQAASTWQEREKILEEIPRSSLPHNQALLLEVAEGSDVDAVRSTAVTRLLEASYLLKSWSELAR